MCDWLTDWLIVRRVSAGKCKQWAANGLYFEMALNNPYLLSVSLAWRDSHYCELRGDLWNVLLVAQQPLVGQGLLTVEVSRSYSDTPHSVGLDLYLTIHNIDNRQTSTSPVRFEPAIPAGEEVTLFKRDEIYKRVEYSQTLSIEKYELWKWILTHLQGRIWEGFCFESELYLNEFCGF